MEYLVDGRVVDYEDGFRMSVGQMPPCWEGFSSFSHIPLERWERIFGPKEI